MLLLTESPILVCTALCVYLHHSIQPYLHPYIPQGLVKCYNISQVIVNAYIVMRYFGTPDDLSNIILCSRIYDLCDTVMVPKHKQTWFQRLHHSSTVIICWLAIRYGYLKRESTWGGFIIYPIVNSIVHVLMYMYYCLPQLGPYKKALTTVQMTQLGLFMGIITYNYVTNHVDGFSYTLGMAYFGMNFLLFVQFYEREYNLYLSPVGRLLIDMGLYGHMTMDKYTNTCLPVQHINVKIAAIGVGTPSVIDNQTLLSMYPAFAASVKEKNTTTQSDSDFIESISGVKQRYIIHNQDQCDGLIKQAIYEALDAAKMGLADIDYLISASASFINVIPDTSIYIQRLIGTSVPSIHVNTVCNSFMSAVNVATSLIESSSLPRYNVLILNFETNYSNLQQDKIMTFANFGDMVVATIVSKSNGEQYIEQSYTISTPVDTATITYPFGSFSGKHEMDFKFQHQSKKVIKSTVDCGLRFLSKFRYSKYDVAVMHQPSMLSLKLLKQFFSNVCDNFALHGNMISATVPYELYLAVHQQKVRRGDRVLLLCEGAGFHFSGILLVY